MPSDFSLKSINFSTFKYFFDDLMYLHSNPTPPLYINRIIKFILFSSFVYPHGERWKFII